MLPNLDSIDSVKIFGHLAYGLILLSFLVKRMLLLRTFAIIASFSSIAYNYQISSQPIWIPIQWNILFILVNCYHITMALLARRSIQLTPIEEVVYSNNFQAMTRVEFKRLLKCGFTRTYHPGHKLIEQDVELNAIFLILEGEACVNSNDRDIACLTQGEFIGEMSFLTHQPTKAQVRLTQVAKIHYWDREVLSGFFSKNPAILAKFHAAIGNQLISRLMAKSLSEAPDRVKLKSVA